SAYGGTQITWSGSLSKSGAGQGVTLQRQLSRGWVTVTSTATTTGGAYTLKTTLTSTAGAYTFRTAAAAHFPYAAAYSAPVTVTSLGVNPGTPEITTTTLPDGDKGVPYSQTLAKTGGAGTWSVSAGALPAGIT